MLTFERGKDHNGQVTLGRRKWSTERRGMRRERDEEGEGLREAGETEGKTRVD